MNERVFPKRIKRAAFANLGTDARKRIEKSVRKNGRSSGRDKRRFHKESLKLLDVEMKGASPCYESILNILTSHKNNLVAYENMRIDQEERKWAIVKGIGKNSPTKENLFGLIF